MIDSKSQKFGLPNSLLVPIAARNIGVIEKYVGAVVEEIHSRTGRVNAVLVKPHDYPPENEPQAPLWKHERAFEFEQRLHPDRQVWVHVDYSAYRRAYIRFGMPRIPTGYVLDHIQNREAVRLRDYSHPYLRLCPVSPQVNTSGGTNSGGEGMEKAYIRSLPDLSEGIQESFRNARLCEILYADPMDLTKMLDIPPGTGVLDGVATTQRLFYPG